MSAEGLKQQFYGIGFQSSFPRNLYDELRFDDEMRFPMRVIIPCIFLKLEGISPFPGLSPDFYDLIYPFPGYDLRTGRSVRMAVSLRNFPTHGCNHYYPGWVVAPPIDGGRWEPVYAEDDPMGAGQFELRSKLRILFELISGHRASTGFRLRATVYQRILRDSLSGAGLYAKVNLVSQTMFISGTPPNSDLLWAPLPVVEREQANASLAEFKRMVRLADQAAQKDEVFLGEEISPLDAPFLIAASEEQLPRYQHWQFDRSSTLAGDIELSVVLDYGRMGCSLYWAHHTPFRLPEKETWRGVLRCFPNEGTLIDIS